MVSLWYPYGIPMVSLWYPYGKEPHSLWSEGRKTKGGSVYGLLILQTRLTMYFPRNIQLQIRITKQHQQSANIELLIQNHCGVL